VTGKNGSDTILAIAAEGVGLPELDSASAAHVNLIYSRAMNNLNDQKKHSDGMIFNSNDLVPQSQFAKPTKVYVKVVDMLHENY
jgi:hypothetical protein